MSVARIRPAVAAERQALRDLHRRASFIWEEDRVWLAAHAKVFGVAEGAIEAERARVAEDASGAVVGFAAVAPGSRGTWSLEDLFVEPARMRRGVGGALLEDAADLARVGGAVALSVIARERLRPFYERHGFVVVGAAETAFRPAIDLRRTLT
jgi:GNAT superfamily N-acetyltransferase